MKNKILLAINVIVLTSWIIALFYFNLFAQEDMSFQNLLDMKASITCDQSEGAKIIQITQYDDKTVLVECVDLQYIYYFPYMEK